MSSKVRVAPVLETGLPKQKKSQTRDPRFDSLCGEYKEGVIFNYFYFKDFLIEILFEGFQKSLQFCE